MSTLVLVGDSVFDNAAYVNGPDVSDQVEAKMPDDWAVSLLAVDGSYILDVQNQLEQLPGDAQILVVSTGGNDVLVQTEVLNDAVTTVGEALLLLGDAVGQFREDYCRMLEAVVATDVQPYICTIYRPDFPDEDFQSMTSTALGLFNDVIVEEASLRLLPILDIRAIFTDSGDYANPIEPSVQGGQKLADEIAGLIDDWGLSTNRGSLIISEKEVN